jgi:aspartate/methionine/tyrosine aminotransferase
VLVPRPGYPLFEFLAELESVEVRSYPLAHDGEWHLDVAALEAAITPRTRAVVIVSPGNPTGAFLKQAELEALDALCAERELALVSDEVFADFAFREDPRRAPSLAQGGRALAFALGGLSKSCGLPQLKLAWTAVSGRRAARTGARAPRGRGRYVPVGLDTGAGGGAVAPRAARGAAGTDQGTRHGEPGVAARGARQRLAGDALRARGGWSAVLRVPATSTEEERTLRLLDSHGVLVHPGYFFDFPSEAFLVVSLLTPPAEFREGIARVLRDAVL